MPQAGAGEMAIIINRTVVGSLPRRTTPVLSSAQLLPGHAPRVKITLPSWDHVSGSRKNPTPVQSGTSHFFSSKCLIVLGWPWVFLGYSTYPAQCIPMEK